MSHHTPRHRSAAYLVLAAVTAVALAAGAYVGIANGAGPPASPDHEHASQTYTIGLFGDMPYNALGKAQYPALLADINASHVALSTRSLSRASRARAARTRSTRRTSAGGTAPSSTSGSTSRARTTTTRTSASTGRPAPRPRSTASGPRRWRARPPTSTGSTRASPTPRRWLRAAGLPELSPAAARRSRAGRGSRSARGRPGRRARGRPPPAARRSSAPPRARGR